MTMPDPSADAQALPSPRHRLSTRIVASSLVALIVVLGMIGLTLWLSWQLEGAGAAINDTGSLRMRANRVAVDRFDERFGVNNLYGDLPDLAPTLRKVTEDARTAVQQPRDPQAIAAAALSAAEGGANGAVELVGNKR